MIIKKLAKLVKKTHYLGITSTTNEQSQQWLVIDGKSETGVFTTFPICRQ